jgi:general secretion pathway protein J
MRSRAQSLGFTLLELLIAIGLMAVLAVLCWRGLDTILVSRDRLTRNGDELQALTIAFAQVDEDLRRSWPARLLEPSSASIRFDDVDGRLVAVHLLREGGGALDPVRLERVSYRLRNGVFERGYGDFIRGAAPDTVVYRWQPLLADVTAIQFRGWLEGIGWIASATTGTAPNKPVTGVELALERGSLKRYLRVFAVQD